MNPLDLFFSIQKTKNLFLTSVQRSTKMKNIKLLGIFIIILIINLVGCGNPTSSSKYDFTYSKDSKIEKIRDIKGAAHTTVNNILEADYQSEQVAQKTKINFIKNLSFGSGYTFSEGTIKYIESEEFTPELLDELIVRFFENPQKTSLLTYEGTKILNQNVIEWL